MIDVKKKRMNRALNCLILLAGLVVVFFAASAETHDFQLAPRLPNGLMLDPTPR